MSRVSKNIIFNLIGQALIVLLGFWGTRLVFHRLGDESLGVLYFAIALSAVLTPLIDLGVSSTVVREVASHLNSNREYVVRLSRTSTLFYWCSYAVLATAIWFTAPWLVSRWIHLKTLDATLAVRTLRFLALALLLMLPRSLYSNLLRGVEHMEFNNLLDVGLAALRQGGTIVIVIRGGGLVEIAYFYLGCFLLNILAYFVASARFFPWRAFLPGFSRDVARQNAAFTSRMGAYTVLGIVQMESDKAILGKLVPIGLLGFYGVAQTAVVRANQIPGAVMQAAFPKLSALFHEKDHAGFVREYHRLQDLVCYSTVPIFAAIIFAARPLFTYLLNAGAAQILLLPTALLCLACYMNGTLNMPAAVSTAVGRPDIGARQNLYALFGVTPVTVLLIWKWGLIGAGLSLVLYYLYAYSYGARRVASECLGMAPRDWYLHVLKVLGLALVTFGMAWLTLAVSGQSSIASLALAYFLAAGAYACAAYQAIGEELREGFIGLRGRLAGAALRAVSSN